MPASETAIKALNLARMGVPLRTIAARLYDTDVEAALADVSTALQARVDYDEADSTKLDLERIDLALMAIATSLQAGDPKAVETMLRLMDRRDRLTAKANRREGPGEIRRDTEKALTAATHLTPMDDGAKAALLKLADSLDYLVEHDGLSPRGSLDNVTGPTYLRYCEALGLTPAARARSQKKTSGPAAAKEPPTRGRKSKVQQLRDQHAARQAAG